ncbi:TYR3-like protein [Mya arenaria]|uniref:TYR3-like protein n=1 Tax=Mya arenaria TaxID=6604 RepID=A0ABY7EW52_MYAAR|nr:tyrosinase-like protein 1 [Mya arenaria]WAR13051.1 TYR3-like protein [Mya arenaria]
MEFFQATIWLLAISTVVVSQSTRMDTYSDMPAEVQQCVAQLTNGTNDGAKVSEEAHIQCMQQFVWKADRIRWDAAVNMTDKETEFINDIIRSVFKHRQQSSRSKRQIGQGIFPPTGFRIRKEYRRLTDFERMAVHDAFNGIKSNGGYTAFAKLHRGIVINSGHSGPNFLGWHRVYLAMLEESLRRINPMVSLPYWDSTLDNDMANPEMTIVFSPPFLGNGDAIVVTGPFSNWPTNTGPLARAIGTESRLFSKEFIASMMTRCRTTEITFPTAMSTFDLEFAHGGPHAWVNGHMRGLETAAQDPVFFMHHAFVDYIWEMFRIHQFFDCQIDPSRDYPPAGGLHHPLRPMDGFPGYRSIDGYANYWTQFWYRYERSPFCSAAMPSCGSPYLWCDVSRGRCVSAARMAPFSDGMGSPLSSAGYATSPAAANARSIAAQASPGPRFRAPPAEPRTQAGRLGRARFRRAAPNNKTINGTYDTFDVVISSQQNGHLFSHAEPLPLLRVPYTGTVQTRDQLSPSQGTIDRRAKQTETDWFYIPIRVINKINMKSTSRNRRCNRGKQIKVTVQGLNYLGSFVDYPSMTAKSPISTAVAIVAIRVPQIGPSEAMISAVHSCGYSCKPSCLKSDAGPAEYQPCNGILEIKPGELDLFSRSYQGAVQKLDGQVSDKQNNVRMIFHCNQETTSWNVWSSHRRS